MHIIFKENVLDKALLPMYVQFNIDLCEWRNYIFPPLTIFDSIYDK